MVILTSQSLVCRYQEAFRMDVCHSQDQDRPALTSAATRNWQLIVKVAACKGRKCRRSGYAYEAKDLKGDQIFSGGASCLSTSCSVAVQNAIVEAAIKATNLGFRQILFLTNCKRTTQMCNDISQPRWQESSMMTGLHYLMQQGLAFGTLFVPKLILCNVLDIAALAVKAPIHYCWISPTVT